MPLDLTPDIYRSALESLPIGVYITDRSRQILFWNNSAEKITGYLGQEVIGHFCHDNLLMHCDENQVVLCGNSCPLAQTVQDGRPRETNVFLRHKDGQRVPVRVHAVPIRDESGAVVGVAEFFEERSFRAVEMRSPHVREDLTLDKVTEIPDCQSMMDGFAVALQHFTDAQTPFGVLSIAVDDLGRLRHVSGCRAVNAVFYAVAQTLSGGTRPEDLVGRWRDDRFAAVVVCPSAEALRSCAQRLSRLVTLASVPWWGERLSVTVSMGGTMVRPGDTVEALLQRADDALQAAMAARTDSVQVV